VDASPLDRPELAPLWRFLHDRAPDAFLVGGLVRDALLGRTTHDLDLALPRDPFPLADALARALGGTLVPLDEDARVVRVVFQAGGARWWADLSALQGARLEEDLARRDFAVNAMAVPLPEAQGPPDRWPVVDPFGGREDLAHRRLRALRESAFREDPIRLLRGPRLCAQLGLELDPQTRTWTRQHAPLLVHTAPERVRDEFLRLLACPGVVLSLNRLEGLGLLEQVLPELEAGRGVSQPPEHHWDVFHHNLETAGAVERILDPMRRQGDPLLAPLPWHPEVDRHLAQPLSDGHPRWVFLRLAGLLHDIAKPATRTVEPGTGRIRFLGHAEMGEAMARETLRRLRVGHRGVEAVARMVRHHLRPSQMAPPGHDASPRAVFRFFRDLGDCAIDTLYLNLADYLGARGPDLDPEDWTHHCQRVGRILERGLAQPPERLPRLITGHDLQEVFGLTPGPMFRVLLYAVQEAQGAGEIATREEALALVRRLLEEQAHAKGETDAPLEQP